MRRAGAQEEAGQVEVDDRVPLFLLDLDGGPAHRAAGIIHQDVERADPLESVAHRFLVCDVATGL